MPTVSRIRRHLAFAHVIEGQIEGEKKRQCERSLMEGLTASGIRPEAVAITADGCSFVIDRREESRLAAVIQDAKMTVKLRDHCARIALTRTAMDWPLPSLERVMQAFDAESIDIVHLSGDATALTVVVDEREADHVVGVFSRFYQPTAAKVPERLAS